MRPIQLTWAEIKKLGVRPEAGIFRMMNAGERAGFIDRMRQDGFDSDHPLTLIGGDILDGRNRRDGAVALHEAGEMPTPPACREFEEEDGSPTDFVIRENLNRRHLAKNDLAVAAVEALPLFRAEAARRRAAGQQRGASLGGAAGGRGRENSLPRIDTREAIQERGQIAVKEAADAFGIGESTVSRTARAKRDHPDLYEEIVEGKRTVGAAHKRMQERDGKREAKPKPDPKPEKEPRYTWFPDESGRSRPPMVTLQIVKGMEEVARVLSDYCEPSELEELIDRLQKALQEKKPHGA